MAVSTEDKNLGVIKVKHSSHIRETDLGHKCNFGEVGETLFQKPNRELYTKKVEKKAAENKADKEAKKIAEEKAKEQKALYDAAVADGFEGTMEEWQASLEEKKEND